MRNDFVAIAFISALAANLYGQAIGSLVIHTVAGSGLHGDGGPATSAQLISPVGVAADLAGNLYIADVAVIRKVAPDGTISTLAGCDLAGSGGDGGPATAARLGGSLGLAVDAAGNIFIADARNHRIRQITPDGIITTIAGSGTQGFLGDGGPATAARLSQPDALAVEASGTLYISDPRNLPLYITFALLLGVLANSIFEMLKGAPRDAIMLPACSSAGV